MQTYASVTRTVLAQQWTGEPLPGVLDVHPALIVMSADHRHFYLSGFYLAEHLPEAWLPVKEGEGDVMPFALWKIRRGPHVRPEDAPLLRERYERHMALVLGRDAAPAEPFARLCPNGTDLGLVRVGDYLVREGDAWSVVRPVEFERHHTLAVPEGETA